MPANIPTPVIGPFLTDFIDSRRIEPWPFGWSSKGARASDVYEAYKEAATEAGLTNPASEARYGPSGEPVLNHVRFGEVMNALGLSEGHGREGTAYMLTVDSREQVAREQATQALAEPEWLRLMDEADGSLDSDPEELAASVQERFDEYVTRLEDDGTIDRYVEEHFGVYLRWRPGDDSVEQYERARWQRRLAEVEAAMKDTGGTPEWSSLRAEQYELRELLGLPQDD